MEMNLLPTHNYMLTHQWSSDKMLAYYILMITILGIVLGAIVGIILHNIKIGISLGAVAGLIIGIVYGLLKSDIE